jgi:TOBE domain
VTPARRVRYDFVVTDYMSSSECDAATNPGVDIDQGRLSRHEALVVDDVNLQIGASEFFSLLGPSSTAGRSTTRSRPHLRRRVLGVSNLMAATACGPADGGCTVRLGEFSLRAARGELPGRGDCRVVIRPERVVLEPYPTSGENRVAGMVERTVYVGPALQVIVRLAHGERLQR